MLSCSLAYGFSGAAVRTVHTCIVHKKCMYVSHYRRRRRHDDGIQQIVRVTCAFCNYVGDQSAITISVSMPANKTGWHQPSTYCSLCICRSCHVYYMTWCLFLILTYNLTNRESLKQKMHGKSFVLPTLFVASFQDFISHMITMITGQHCGNFENGESCTLVSVLIDTVLSLGLIC